MSANKVFVVDGNCSANKLYILIHYSKSNYIRYINLDDEYDKLDEDEYSKPYNWIESDGKIRSSYFGDSDIVSYSNWWYSYYGIPHIVYTEDRHMTNPDPYKYIEGTLLLYNLFNLKDFRYVYSLHTSISTDDIYSGPKDLINYKQLDNYVIMDENTRSLYLVFCHQNDISDNPNITDNYPAIHSLLKKLKGRM